MWVTNVAVGASIDAADRNETKTNVEWLYNTLGANWPGNVRFPVCVGAGFDIAAPCPVVWPIAVGDSIYQTPGAHPVSELQEDRDKLDWIWDNKCGVDNAIANPTTQAGENPATQALEQVTTQAAANPSTQALEQVVTNVSFQPGCDADCPLEDGVDNMDYTGDDYNEKIGHDVVAWLTNEGDLGTHYTSDQADNSGVNSPDYGGVCPAQFSTYQIVVHPLVNEVAQASHCYAENAGVYTHVFSMVA